MHRRTLPLKSYTSALCMRIMFVIGIFLTSAHADALAQVRIPYENPEIHSRQASGEIPQKTGLLRDKGELVVNRKKQRIEMHSEEGHVRSFYFFHWEYIPELQHTIGFGDNHAFTFVPYDNYFGLMYQRNHIYLFTGLTDRHIQILHGEFSSSQ